jgi:signal transduction histidine kinase
MTLRGRIRISGSASLLTRLHRLSWASAVSSSAVQDRAISRLEYLSRAYPSAVAALATLALTSGALLIGRTWPHPHLDGRGFNVVIAVLAVLVLVIFRRWARTSYPWIVTLVALSVSVNLFLTARLQPTDASVNLFQLRVLATVSFVVLLFRLPFRIAAAIGASIAAYSGILLIGVGTPDAIAAFVSIAGIAAVSVLTLWRLENREHEVVVERNQREREFARVTQVNGALEASNRRLEHANEELRCATERYEEVQRAALALLDGEKKAAEELSRARLKFMKQAAHDLRNSASGMRNYLELMQPRLREGELTESREQLSKALAGAHVLTKRIHQILAYTRLETGEFKPRIEPVDLKYMLAEIENELSPRALAKSLALRIHVDQRRPAIVESDATVLWQIVSNLVSNAIKFTYQTEEGHGGVLVGVSGVWGPSLRINVWDTGIGIPEQYLEQIWEPHKRVHQRGSVKEEGDGLGLAIVEAACRQLPGHRISVRSIPGKGTRFRLDVPRAAVGHQPDYSEERVPELNSEITGLRAVLVEDDNYIRDSEDQLLKDWGVDLVGCGASLDEVLSRTSADNVPDIIISDFDLGDCENGADVIVALRSKYNRCIPALVITGKFDDPAVSLAAFENVKVYPKPLSPSRLRWALASITPPRQGS